MWHHAGMSKETTSTKTTSDLVDRINRAFLATPAKVRVLKTSADGRVVRFRLEADWLMSPRSAAENARMILGEHDIWAKESYNSDLGGWHVRAAEWA